MLSVLITADGDPHIRARNAFRLTIPQVQYSAGQIAITSATAFIGSETIRTNAVLLLQIAARSHTR